MASPSALIVPDRTGRVKPPRRADPTIVLRCHDDMQLVWPSEEYLPGYVAALRRGWSPDNVRGEAAAREHLEKIAADPAEFVRSLVDREATGAPITLPDGSTVPRIPGYHRWMWDGEFCGSIGFRWQPGTTALPPHCLGHIGYSVVPWKQRLGYATLALKQLLPEARAEGLPFVELTTVPSNIPSQRVILANGGVLVERFTAPPQFDNRESLRYRISLA
jgi:predicted acetyltransferase